MLLLQRQRLRRPPGGVLFCSVFVLENIINRGASCAVVDADSLFVQV